MKLSRLLGWSVMLSLVVLVAACSSSGPVRRISEPSASLQQLTVQADGRWSVDLRLQNYSSIPMRFESVSLDVSVGDEAAGKLVVQPALEIGPESAAVPAPWMRYVFPKGYIAVNGASLTVAEARRERDGSGWFEVWLIPETLRSTTFGDKGPGDALNLEIERSAQVFVDTVRDAIDERLGPLLPLLEGLLAREGKTLDELAAPTTLPRG